MADITPGYTFTSGETNITHSKLNTATAGTISNTFHTGKGAVSSNPDKTTTQLMVYDTSAVTFKKGSLGDIIFNSTELISEQTAITVPAVDDLFLISDTSDSSANRKITTTNVLFGAAEFTSAIAYDDLLSFYDTSGTAIHKIKVGNLFWKLPASGALALTDEIPVTNTGGTTATKATVAQVYNAINVLTNKATAKDNDVIPIYDTTGTASKGATLRAFGPLHRGVDAGASDAYAVACVPTVFALYTGLRVSFKAATANTGACTLAVDGLAATSLKKLTGQDPVTNDILANQWIDVVYDGTNFQMIGADPTLVSTTVIADFTIPGSAGTTMSVTHSLGVVPRFVRWVLVAQTTPGLGYTAGDEIDITMASSASLPVLYGVANATSLTLVNRVAETSIVIPEFSSPGTYTAITAGKWKARCYYSP